MLRRFFTLSLLAGLVLAGISSLDAGQWARFRGPNGDGIATGQDLPTKFSEGDGIAWKVPIVGLGNSSPVIWDKVMFLQTSTTDGGQRLLLCLDAATGKEIWSRSLPGKKAHTHAKNTLASSTPTTDGEAVFVSFWDGVDISLVAYNMKGDVLWNRQLGQFVSQHGAGASPILYKNSVILANDMDKDDATKKPVAKPATLMAFNKKTGETLWEVPRKAFRACYSPPFLLEKAGQPAELIVTSTTAITSYDPENGSEIWHWNPTFTKAKMPLRTIASTFVRDNMLYAFSGDGGGDRQMWALALEGTGKNTSTKISWSNHNPKDFPYVPCCLTHGPHLYFVNDKGFAGCFEAKTGKEVWMERLPEATFSSSPVLVDGKVYAPSEQGDVYVFNADPAFQLISRNNLGEPIRSSPAVVDGRLYIRGQNHLFCISKKK